MPVKRKPKPRYELRVEGKLDAVSCDATDILEAAVFAHGGGQESPRIEYSRKGEAGFTEWDGSGVPDLGDILEAFGKIRETYGDGTVATVRRVR